MIKISARNNLLKQIKCIMEKNDSEELEKLYSDVKHSRGKTCIGKYERALSELNK